MPSKLEKPYAVGLSAVQQDHEHAVIAVAATSLHHYQETGLHITLDELKQWVKAVRKNRKTKIQPCHK